MDRWLQSPEMIHASRTALTVAGIVLAAIIGNALVRRAAARMGRGLAARSGERRAQALTVITLLANVGKYAVFGVALVTALDAMGVPIAPLLAGAGFLGLAVGFGAQSLVRDVVTGFFIIFEGQYAVGQLVEVNGQLGVVEEVGLRVTRLRSLSGEVRFFANGGITTVTNFDKVGMPYLLTVPAQVPKAALVAALADFQRLFPVLAGPAEVSAPITLESGREVLQARLRVFPSRQPVLEANLAAQVVRSLAAQGLTVAAEEVALATEPAL